MTILADQLLKVAGAYVEAAAVDWSRTSWRAFGESKTLDNLKAGVSSVTLRRADRALAWFSLHWPDGAEWPSAVPRPSVPCEASP